MKKMTEYVQAIKDIASFTKEPKWFTAWRNEALSVAEVKDLPKPDKTKIDQWNFLSYQASARKNYKSVEDLPKEVKPLIGSPIEEQMIFVQRNEVPSGLTIPKELVSKGVIFTDIFTAIRDHEELVKKYLMKEAVAVGENRLTAIHAALLNGGVFLYVPRNVVIEKPVQAIFIVDDPSFTLYNHVLIVTEDNSSVTYVENYISTSSKSSGVANLVSEVIAGQNAIVKYGAVDTLSKGMTTYINRRGIAKRDATIEWALGFMNDGNTVSENVTKLIGDGSKGNTKSVVVGRGEQIQNFTTSVVHYGKNSEGFILKHGVMKDSASSIFNGIGKIELGATKANAEQESRVLMLSEKARGDANPILLIDEDDVMAGHAASVGRVDPLQLYYLMSRGISKVEAEKLIIYGFLAPVVNQIPIESVKNQLTEVIERKFK